MSDPKALRFQTAYASADPQQTERWLNALDRLGADNVRIRHAHTGGGPNDFLHGIGVEPIPRGFVEDWLHYRGRMERRWRLATVLLASLGALASGSACTAAVISLLKHW